MQGRGGPKARAGRRVAHRRPVRRSVGTEQHGLLALIGCIPSDDEGGQLGAGLRPVLVILLGALQLAQHSHPDGYPPRHGDDDPWRGAFLRSWLHDSRREPDLREHENRAPGYAPLQCWQEARCAHVHPARHALVLPRAWVLVVRVALRVAEPHFSDPSHLGHERVVAAPPRKRMCSLLVERHHRSRREEELRRGLHPLRHREGRFDPLGGRSPST
mmetsp:Transcript_85605/g.173725  ORF Transcript_85605/g.173725 Transcript_85605/m.173725 type:complete len:216 (-) Transcript_85605:253-900(-)